MLPYEFTCKWAVACHIPCNSRNRKLETFIESATTEINKHWDDENNVQRPSETNNDFCRDSVQKLSVLLYMELSFCLQETKGVHEPRQSSFLPSCQVYQSLLYFYVSIFGQSTCQESNNNALKIRTLVFLSCFKPRTTKGTILLVFIQGGI